MYSTPLTFIQSRRQEGKVEFFQNSPTYYIFIYYLCFFVFIYIFKKVLTKLCFFDRILMLFKSV